jgi:DNA-binding NarL/FixJ family response regulator
VDGRIDIGVVGEQRLVLEAIAAALSAAPGVRATWCDVARSADGAAFDVWLVDGSDGLSSRLTHLRRRTGASARVYVLDCGDSVGAVGTSGPIGPDVDLAALVDVLRQAETGPTASSNPVSPAVRCPLSPRELEVLGALAAGLSQDEIGTSFDVSSQTVRTHIQHAMAKLGVHSRRHAVDAALEAGWLGEGPQPGRRLGS